MRESQVHAAVSHEICDWRNHFPQSAVWNEFAPGVFNPPAAAETPRKVSHEVCDWVKITFVPFAYVHWGRVLRESACHKIFPRPVRRDQNRS